VIAPGLLPLLLLAAPARAHGLGAGEGAAWDPWVLAPVALAALGFALGTLRLSRRGRSGAAALRRGLLFAGGIGAVALALHSPLAAIAHGSFAAHMAEHELLMVVAAPLLVLARPIGPWLWSLPPGARRASGAALAARCVRGPWRVLSDPVVASALQATALWAWHLPALFQAALENPWVHRLQHIGFLGTALLFWWSLLARARAGYGLAALHLFAASVQAGLLGALFLFAPRPLYPGQGLGAAALGMTPLEDQQLAGLVMAGAACLVYPAAALRLLALWIAARRPPSEAAAGEEARRALRPA
jgi:putative membrane protein